MSVTGISSGAASYLQYLQRPQPSGQPTQAQSPVADHDGDSDDVAGASGADTDHDRGGHVNIRA